MKKNFREVGSLVPVRHDRGAACAPGRAISLREIGLVSLVALAACAVYAFRAGLDFNFDLRNYHLYSVYAVLHGRHSIDVAPGQMQTWFNPAGQIISYVLISNLRPWLATFVLAALAALNIVVVYAIAKLSLHAKVRETATAVVIAALAATLAFVAPLFLSEIGTTFNDVNIAFLVLAGILLLFASDFSQKGLFWCGLLVGVATGLKLTSILFDIGIVAALLTQRQTRTIRAMSFLGLGMVVGYMPTGGIWSIYLWIHYDNPVFPLFNNIFKSDAYLAQSMADLRFRLNGISDFLALAPKFALKMYSTAESPFRDTRFLILLVLAGVLLPVLIGKGQSTDVLFDHSRVRFLAVFSIMTVLIWSVSYGIQRYIIVIEQLAPLLIFAVIDRAIGHRPYKLVSYALVTAFIVATTSPADWGRLPLNQRIWKKNRAWMQARFPDSLIDRDVMYFMLGYHPMSYVIASAPPGHAFMRTEGNMPIGGTTGLAGTIRDRIAAHKGEFRTIGPAPPAANEVATLEAYGLRPGAGECLPIDALLERLLTCRLERLEGKAPG